MRRTLATTAILLVLATSSASAGPISETVETVEALKATVARLTAEGKVMLDRLPGLCPTAVLNLDQQAGTRNDATTCCVTLLEGGANASILGGALLVPVIKVPKTGDRIADAVSKLMRKRIEEAAGKGALAKQRDTVLEATWGICYAAASK